MSVEELVIEQLGGVTVLAKRLGYSNSKGPQRVSNWKRRGIPPRILLEHRFIRTAFNKATKEEEKSAA